MNKQQRFEALVRGHSSVLYRFAYWLTGGHAATAEDLVQETFLRAWKSLDQLQQADAAKSWLMTILRRENARRFERKQLDYVDIDPVDVALEQADLILDLDRQTLHQAIAMLDIKYREPLLLQAIGGYSCDEIAESMNIKRGAVMTRLFRAKQMISDMVHKDSQEHRHG